MSAGTGTEGGAIGLIGGGGGSPLLKSDDAALSSRKRKAAEIARGDGPEQPLQQGQEQQRPLVPATKEGLEEMRRRVSTVVEETMRNRLAGTEVVGNGEKATAAAAAGSNGQQQHRHHQDAAMAAYLRAFQAAVMSKVASMCDVQDAREQREADQLMEEMVQFSDDMQAARERLRGTRARVARLADSASRDSLLIAKAADDRAAATLEAKAVQATRERETGGPFPPPDGAGYDDLDGAGGTDGFAGIDGDVLEPKVSLLIGKLSELPGPLKSVLQEIPELTAALAKLVQNVEAAMSVGESRTEALLGKSPPMPLTKGSGSGGVLRGGAGGDFRYRPEEVRETAREARVEQARKDWEASGVGVLGGIFS